MKGLFGDMFDFDRNGELDSFEMAMEFKFYEELTREDDDDDYDDYDGCDD